MAIVRIDRSSEEYREFARLYAIAREQYPSPINRWEGELYATVEELSWGSFQGDGSFRLSKELVFDQLGPDAHPHQQVQALTTILHESMHARVEIDAENEPNAVPSKHSKALDEGLTEWMAVDGVAAFADAAGYGQLPDAEPAYPAAYDATNALLEYAAGPEGAQQLAIRAIDQPVVMRWDVIADEIVKNRLGDVVPADPAHQQAARAELINAMTRPGWEDLHETSVNVGPAVAQETNHALDEATDRIRAHYAQNPGMPYPAANPNFRVPQQQTSQSLGGSQERVVGLGGQVDLTKLPPPNAASRVDSAARTPSTGQPAADHAPAARSTASSAEMRLLSGTAPAAEATQRRPDLGDGARGAGGPAGAGPRQQSTRSASPDRSNTPTGRG